MSKDKERIIELQRSIRVAKLALERICYGHARDPIATADEALQQMRPLEPKMQLQGLLGHASKKELGI